MPYDYVCYQCGDVTRLGRADEMLERSCPPRKPAEAKGVIRLTALTKAAG